MYICQDNSVDFDGLNESRVLICVNLLMAVHDSFGRLEVLVALLIF
jgi:hypothetical protein